MSRSMIQQFYTRSRKFLAGRRSQWSVARLPQFTMWARGTDTAVEQNKALDQQIKMFNGLLQAVCAKLLVKIRELDRANGDLQNLMEVSAIPAVFVDEKLLSARRPGTCGRPDKIAARFRLALRDSGERRHPSREGAREGRGIRIADGGRVEAAATPAPVLCDWAETSRPRQS